MKLKEEILQIINKEIVLQSTDCPWRYAPEFAAERIEVLIKQKLLQHGIMQAEGSDGAKGAAVGNSAAGQSGSEGVMKWCDSCGKVTKWIDGECENWTERGGSAKGALPR